MLESLLNKVSGLSPATLFKIDSSAVAFDEFFKNFKTSILYNIKERLLLTLFLRHHYF